jgi:hypothetical protein
VIPARCNARIRESALLFDPKSGQPPPVRGLAPMQENTFKYART